MGNKRYISGLYPDELKEIIEKYQQPAYRAKQILAWMYKKGVLSFSQMANLPENFRRQLEEKIQTIGLHQEAKFTSKMDKTSKYIFRTADGQAIESVYIPTQKRATVCISTQIGCAFGCVFCASGKDGLVRNLEADEIVSQVLLVKNDNLNKPLTNIVFMGMGEPLANYDNTLRALRILNHPDCLGIAARKITISTCGLPKQIIRFAGEGLQVELSISLHAADEALRSELMPVNKKYPLSELIKTAKEYTRITNRIITFEYVIIGGMNDKKEHALNLAKLLYGLKAKLNLILFNPIDNLNSKLKLYRVTARNLDNFKQVLEQKKINFTVRRSRGNDIKGACGQLAGNLKLKI